jgi:hypothetical protein
MELSDHFCLLQKQKLRRKNRAEDSSKSQPEVLQQALFLLDEELNCDVASSNSAASLKPQVSHRISIAARIKSPSGSKLAVKQNF